MQLPSFHAAFGLLLTSISVSVTGELSADEFFDAEVPCLSSANLISANGFEDTPANEPPIGLNVTCWTLTGTSSVSKEVVSLFSDPGATPLDAIDPSTLSILGTSSFDGLTPIVPAAGTANVLLQTGEIVWVPDDPDAPEIYVINYEVCDDVVGNVQCASASLKLVFNDPPNIVAQGGPVSPSGTFNVTYASILAQSNQNVIAPGFDQGSLLVSDAAYGAYGVSTSTVLGGECTVNEQGGITYTAPGVVSGQDSCFIRLCETRPSQNFDDFLPQACSIGEVSFAVSDTFQAVDDQVLATQDTQAVYLISALLANDISAAFESFSLIAAVTDRGGTVSLSIGEVIYTPPSGFVGQDIFDYEICSQNVLSVCDTATVFVEVGS